MSRASRSKGARGELEVVHILRDHGWKDARRTHDGREQRARGDIANGPAGVSFEIKRQERLNVPAAMQQCISDSNHLDIPALVHRPSRAPWCVTVPFDDFLELLKLREAMG